jgi:hypothetical protein
MPNNVVRDNYAFDPILKANYELDLFFFQLCSFNPVIQK